MAARFNKAHDEKTRLKIQTSQLINRLQSHVNGEAELSATQIRAAEILLKKTLPDLSAVEWTGELSGPNGQPIQYDLSALPTEEVRLLEHILSKSAATSAGPAGTGASEPDSVH